MHSMGGTAEGKGAESDRNHGLGNGEALLVVANETAPVGHPAEHSFDDPSTQENAGACADRVEGRLNAGRVGDVGRR
jgi:hypothetical protein